VPSSISARAVGLALEHDVDIVFLGKFGIPVGRLIPSKRGSLALIRQRQVEVASSGISTVLAKKFVESKGKAQLGFLRFMGKRHNADFGQEAVRIEAYLACGFWHAEGICQFLAWNPHQQGNQGVQRKGIAHTGVQN